MKLCDVVMHLNEYMLHIEWFCFRSVTMNHDVSSSLETTPSPPLSQETEDWMLKQLKNLTQNG
jgi:hypothetical protein